MLSLKRRKNVHILLDLEKCCQTHIYLQNFVLIQPRTSPPKICKIFEKCIFEKCIFEKCIFEKCIFEKCIFRKFCKFLAGSFSAVSKRNFARKYAFDSIFQALQDVHTSAPLQIQHFSKQLALKNKQFTLNFSNILANLQNLIKNHLKMSNF